MIIGCALQSLTPEVGALISRRMDIEKTAANFKYIRESTGIHVHADLIIGLPGESLATFAQSFDQLWYLSPGEIQVGILKLLKGTPIKRHVANYAMLFSQTPPYEIIQNNEFPYVLMQKMKRFARYFEIFANSERFERGLDLIIESSGRGPFYALFDWSEWLWEEIKQVHAISLKRQYELCERYLREQLGVSQEAIVDALADDFLDSRSNPTATPKGLPDFMRQRVDLLLQRQKLARR